MMRKMMKGALIVAAILTLPAEALQAKQVTAPQKATAEEGINPKLWYKLALVKERAYLFTHWEQVHPHRILPGAATPRVYQRNTHSIDEVTYELDGQRYTLSHYIEKANISGLMVLRDGEVRLEYYGQGLDARSRNHIWSATKSFTSTLIAMALFEGKISSLDDPAKKYAPQFKGSAYGETSIQHLLMMSSGIDYFHFKGSPNRNDMYMVAMAHTPSHEPSVDAEGKITEGYSFQFWLPADYDQEFMAAGAFGQYLWIDRKQDFVVAQFSIGGPRGQPGISAKEKEAVMRALGSFVLGESTDTGRE